MERLLGNVTGMVFLAALLISPVLGIKSLFNIHLYNVHKLRGLYKDPLSYISLAAGGVYIFLCFIARWHFEGIVPDLLVKFGLLYSVLLVVMVIGLVVLARESILACLSLLGGSVFLLVTFIYYGRGI